MTAVDNLDQDYLAYADCPDEMLKRVFAVAEILIRAKDGDRTKDEAQAAHEKTQNCENDVLLLKTDS